MYDLAVGGVLSGFADLPFAGNTFPGLEVGDFPEDVDISRRFVRTSTHCATMGR